jgi:hypothetical protein
MTVTKATSLSWTVLRHVGGTQPAPHPLFAPVMFTPLPLLPTTPTVYCSFTDITCPTNLYAGGSQAQMCLIGPNVPAGPNSYIDIGDGWITPNR